MKIQVMRPPRVDGGPDVLRLFVDGQQVAESPTNKFGSLLTWEVEVAKTDPPAGDLRDAWAKALADLIRSDPLMRDMTPVQLSEALRETNWYKSRASTEWGREQLRDHGIDVDSAVQAYKEAAEFARDQFHVLHPEYKMTILKDREGFVSGTGSIIAVVRQDDHTLVIWKE